MADLTTELLRTLPPQDLAALLPAPVMAGDNAAVILRVVDTALVEVYFAGRITSYGTAVLRIEPITDPALREETLRNAVEALTICRRVALEAHAEHRQAHAARVEEIRAYAISKHEDGTICRDGLDGFLSHFGLQPYETRVRVTYTISGSYEVEDSSEEAATEDAEKYLVPDLTGLDNVDDYSTSFELTVNVSETEG
ncbi:hypothetical protein C8250_028850 [Streptomyces sp. So13.3]|uniref:hypothetical protein n=1 Tax=Streptomyces sp. So13.3 TaxID=2136173 RepID=UPI001105931F|nr:hypothetical protein [Streptomyces sp. So13.3]QNA75362.1 hypothetical protein C8250_028850 [Streptomyces sp. So13.3]